MTIKGESVTLKGENTSSIVPASAINMISWQHIAPLTDPSEAQEVDRGINTKEFVSGQIHFRYTSGAYASGHTAQWQPQHPVVQLLFVLKGSCRYFIEKAKKPFLALHQQQHNLVLLPAEKLEVGYLPEEQTETFEINFSTDFLFRYLPPSHPLYAYFRSSLEKNTFALLYKKDSLPIPPRIVAILYELLNCPFSGHCRSLIIEARVVELLALQFEQQEQLLTQTLPVSIKEEDLVKMRQVKEILLQNLETTPSLKDLAHEVGTNEYNLKKQFKEVFGTTVFGYLHAYKMEKAKEQLLEGKLMISEIAWGLGYKHATHFTSAFKKFFGYLPNKIKLTLLLPLLSLEAAVALRTLVEELLLS